MTFVPGPGIGIGLAFCILQMNGTVVKFVILDHSKMIDTINNE